jgi:hypothetical protein
MAELVWHQFQHYRKEGGGAGMEDKEDKEGMEVWQRVVSTTVRSSPHQGQDTDHAPSEQAGVWRLEDMAAASEWLWVGPQEQRKGFGSL